MDDAPQSAEDTGRRPRLQPAEVVPLRADETPSAAADASTSLARRPPVLASEILRQEMEPDEPGRDALRRLVIALGLGGTALALAVGSLSSLSVGVALACALLAALGAAPMPYTLRAGSVFGAGIAAAAVSAALHPRTAPIEVSLALLVIALGSALRLRAYYRASRSARVLVGVAVLALATWLLASGTVGAFFDAAPRWERWAPTLVYTGLGVLLLLSLLAFMESATRGGCHLWATLLGVWYAAHVAVDAFASRSLSGLRGWRLEEAALPVLAAIGVLVAIPAGAQLLGTVRKRRRASA